MPRYRMKQTAYLKKHPNHDAPTLIFEGEEIDYPGIPGPHFEPLDDDARAALAAYYQDNPGATLDPTRRLSVSIEPSADPRTLDQAVQRQLDRIFAASARAPAGGASAEVAELREQVAALTQQIAALAAAQTPAKHKGSAAA